MSKYKMISPAVPNVPWQEGPESFTGAPVWRYSENPIIGRNPLKNVARIFNSAVMPYGDGFIGVFRGEQNNGIPFIPITVDDLIKKYNINEIVAERLTSEINTMVELYIQERENYSPYVLDGFNEETQGISHK